MTSATWGLLIGALLILMALVSTSLRSLPFSAAALYMAIGYVIGPERLGWIDLDLRTDSDTIETISEIAVLVSLFAVGLRLQVRAFRSSWFAPVLLATVGMVATIALLTLAGLALQWSLPAALLAGAILAPTDPVLASDVQVRHEADSDALRFGLTAEGGLNDGAAFPFVLLALGLFGAREMGAGGVQWLARDVLWAIAGGLALGWTSGAAFTRLVLFLRQEKQQAFGMESFLALGLIGLTYGVAAWASVYGFLAVFMTGLSMRNVQRDVGSAAGIQIAAPPSAPDSGTPAAESAKEALSMTREVLGFAQELEKFVELASMLVIGCLLRVDMFSLRNIAFAVILICVVRPVAVFAATFWTRWTPTQRRLAAWFGIRGVGSLYYLAFATSNGAPSSELQSVADVVLLSIALSVVVHGVSATPLMALYHRTRRGSTRFSE